MLVMSILRMVGAARLRISFGTGVSVILRNCSALRSAFAMGKTSLSIRSVKGLYEMCRIKYNADVVLYQPIF